MNKASNLKKDFLITLGLGVFGAYIFLISANFPKEAGMFPKLVSTILLTLCGCQLIIGAYKIVKTSRSEENQEKNIANSKYFWFTIITLLVYPILILIVGYIPSTLVYLAYSMHKYGYRKKIGIASISIGVTVILYIVFVVILRTRLPVGLLLGGF